MKKEVQLEIAGREKLDIRVELDDKMNILSAQLIAKGSLQFLEEASAFRAQLTGALPDVDLPEGKTTGQLLLKEALLRLRDQWQPPYTEEELCHCRAILTKKVDQAILIGAHDPETVSDRTSASTACGTCRPDVEAMIQYRLG